MAKKDKGPEFVEDMLAQQDGADDSNSSSLNSRANEIIRKFNLPDRYTILPDMPIRELGGGFAKAFEVRDAKQKEDIYGTILQNSIPIRFAAIQKAKNFFHPNNCNVVDSGFADVARGEYGSYAVIYDKPKGIKLSQFVERKIALGEEFDPPLKLLISEEFVAAQIVHPINEVLKLYAENELCHGRINVNNVFLTGQEDGKLMVGECFSEPCGFSQPHQYETVDRAQSMPLGKGLGTLSSDYFALGVTVLHAIMGRLPGEEIEPQEFIAQRLAKGTYNTYLGNMEFSPRITDLLRGLLTDNVEERWGYEQVYNWVRGKKYNLIRPKIRKEAVRSYEFLGVQYMSKASLAYAYFTNWDEAARDIRDKRLGKWLELSVNDKETADILGGLVVSTGGEKSKSRSDNDELVAKSLIILDPDAPIRYRTIAVNLDGVGPMIADSWLHQNQTEMQIFGELLNMNLMDYKAARMSDQKIDRWILQRLQNYIRGKSLGFGIERCLYDLNPSLPCQSPIIGSQFIIDINQLLYYFNDNAGKIGTTDVVDRHVSAFIASKLELAQEIKLKISKYLKDERAKIQVIKLALIAFAQRKSNSGKLTSLGHWFMGRMNPIIDSLHGRKNRKDFETELKSYADVGNIEGMLQLIINSDYFPRDTQGFAEAQQIFKAYDMELRQIRSRQGLAMHQDTHYLFGLQLAKIIGVLVFLVTIVASTL